MSLKRQLLATALLGLFAATAGAQVYRITGPDGKVTFSDKPPVEPNARATAAQAAAGGSGGSGAALPFELRQIANRYPVTIYTGDNCGPCGAGRAMLVSRGIPFTEKTIKTNEDIEALQRMSGATTLPFATIGGQQLKGYSEQEWTQFLDAAGYPKTSQLPSSYRPPAATPLVAVQRPAAAPAPAPQAAAPTAAAPAPAPAPAGENPAGIRF